MPSKNSVSNLASDFYRSVEKFRHRICFKHKKDGAWISLSWLDVGEKVKEVALGLSALGVKKGDTVAIFSNTCMEWTVSDLAILSLGAVSVPIYQSTTPDQVAYILNNSGSRWVFAENTHLLKKIKAELPNLPQLQRIVLFHGKKEAHEMQMTLEELQKLGVEEGNEAAWREGLEAIEPNQTATLVYTSGTTGPPKGAILTHGNFLSGIDACTALFTISEEDTSLLFLPLAHILAREMQFYHLRVGFTQAFAESIDKLVDNLGEIRPHFFVAVPRIFEKVYEKILQQVEAGSPTKQSIFKWGVVVGGEVSRRVQKGQSLSPGLWLQSKIASRLVFGKLRRRLGGRLMYAVSGGAPLSREIAQFFHAAGILILEGYGLTETTAAVNCNSPSHYAFGTVGLPVKGVQEKIAPDGEILVKGPMVFQGYYKNPEATREVLSEDGWFKTGDIGEFDARGYLKITDRKKDLIITAGGKNIAPQNIENQLKTVPVISQAVIIGDRRKYLAALLTLTKDVLEEWAQKMGLQVQTYDELVKHPTTHQWLHQILDEKNKTLASYESIKRFAILPNDFSQETGELTPTLKVKRKFVNEKYRDVIENLYQE